MCLTVLEICFLVAGIALLFTGKVPKSIFQVMFGKGEYFLPPMQARLFGAVLASAAPLIFTVSFLLGLLALENADTMATAFEIVYDLFIAVVALVVARKIRKPVAPVPPATNLTS